MYSWEILQLLELKQYLLSVEEYFKICDTSPQITRVQYLGENDFKITTSDNYEFKFKVKQIRR